MNETGYSDPRVAKGVLSAPPVTIQTQVEGMDSNVQMLCKRLEELRARLADVLHPSTPEVAEKELAAVETGSPHARALRDVDKGLSCAHRIVTDITNRLQL